MLTLSVQRKKFFGSILFLRWIIGGLLFGISLIEPRSLKAFARLDLINVEIKLTNV
jgi:hypothetical protein